LKRLLWLLLLAASPALAQSNSVTFTRQANSAWATSWPACSTTVTTDCLSGFTLSDITNATKPVVISSTIAPTALTYTQTPAGAAGSHTYSLVVNGKDQSGNPAASTPVTSTATIPSNTPPPPVNFSVTP
jgi:hypothetical protein